MGLSLRSLTCMRKNIETPLYQGFLAAFAKGIAVIFACIRRMHLMRATVGMSATSYLNVRIPAQVRLTELALSRYYFNLGGLRADPPSTCESYVSCRRKGHADRG